MHAALILLVVSSLLPAARLKLFDHGLLRPGMKAYAAGFRDVLVNGKAIIANRELTKERPGRVL